MMDKYGATFNFYLMWENIISTYEPQNIKVGLNPRMGRRIYEMILLRLFLQPISLTMKKASADVVQTQYFLAFINKLIQVGSSGVLWPRFWAQVCLIRTVCGSFISISLLHANISSRRYVEVGLLRFMVA